MPYNFHFLLKYLRTNQIISKNTVSTERKSLQIIFNNNWFHYFMFCELMSSLGFLKGAHIVLPTVCYMFWSYNPQLKANAKRENSYSPSILVSFCWLVLVCVCVVLVWFFNHTNVNNPTFLPSPNGNGVLWVQPHRQQ